jgi:hypothetical protein
VGSLGWMPVITRCADARAEVQARIAHRFARSEARERAGRSLAGLLDRVERTNGWQLADALGETGPRGVQRLLSAATWDTDGVRDDLRAYVVDHLGDAVTGVLIVDETGCLKKGRKSCGVARQDHGHGGRHRAVPGRCLPGVRVGEGRGVHRPRPGSAAGMDGGPRAPDRSRHPRGDPVRDQDRPRAAHARAGVRRRRARALGGGGCVLWPHDLRQWLETRGRADALIIPKTNAVRFRGRRERAEQSGERLCADPSLGPWACLELSEECAAGMRRWLLVRCDAEDPDEHRYFLAYGPEATDADEVVRVCTTRWQIEQCLAEAKGEVGLDQYEVRTWNAWHRHATLCLLAHADLVAMRHAARREERGETGAPTPV